MKKLSVLKQAARLSVLLMFFVSSSAFSANPLITRYFSGIWDQPDQESQGFILQIGEQAGDTKVGIVYWFTYGEDLQTTWFLAVGPVEGNVIDMVLYTGFNIAFMEGNLEGDANVLPVGTLRLEFQNCNQGRAFYETDEEVIGSGEFRIKRINSIYRTRCSGGVSDDTPSGAKPEILDVRLLPPGEEMSGKGKAKYWIRTDRSDFKVEGEGLVEGTSYTLQVCGAVQGEAMVADVEGEVEFDFRSPESDGKALLNFDPEECPIEVLDGTGVVLTSGDAVLSPK